MRRIYWVVYYLGVGAFDRVWKLYYPLFWLFLLWWWSCYLVWKDWRRNYVKRICSHWLCLCLTLVVELYLQRLLRRWRWSWNMKSRRFMSRIWPVYRIYLFFHIASILKMIKRPISLTFPTNNFILKSMEIGSSPSPLATLLIRLQPFMLLILRRFISKLF